ncbi:FlgO family outer membrane protein [Alteromonadaceae bacterium BrNp21-10]|nr:FlgO family outer membrane protein [Alteromonadaceae bacterium BrNp21-10]
MKALMKPLMLCASILLLQGCEITSFFSQPEIVCYRDNGNYETCTNEDVLSAQSQQQMSSYVNAKNTDPSLFKNSVDFQMLAEYVEQMALDIGNDLHNMQFVEPIAVTSFVDLDSDLKTTNKLGIQLAEYFINELQNVGLPVYDIKVSGNVQVSNMGDFAFSRDFNDLQNKQDITYILAGTMVKNDKGIVINSRVIGLIDNRVIASATKLIPNIMLAKI